MHVARRAGYDVCPRTTRRCPHQGSHHEGGADMGLDDKISNEATEAKGKAKEAAGSATDNDSLESEGKADQGEAKVKKAGEPGNDWFYPATLGLAMVWTVGAFLSGPLHLGRTLQGEGLPGPRPLLMPVVYAALLAGLFVVG